MDKMEIEKSPMAKVPKRKLESVANAQDICKELRKNVAEVVALKKKAGKKALSPKVSKIFINLLQSAYGSPPPNTTIWFPSLIYNL